MARNRRTSLQRNLGRLPRQKPWSGDRQSRKYAPVFKTGAPWQRGGRVRFPSASAMKFIWLAAVALVSVELVQGFLALGGGDVDLLFRHWLHNSVLWLAAVLSLIGTLRSERGRIAWTLMTAALASWALGDTLWTVLYAGDGGGTPSATLSDVLWFAWYPLVIAALIPLIRDRVPGFEFHRWIDGVVVMLVLATFWVAIFVEPVADASGLTGLAEAIEFAYPLADMMLVGGVLGVVAVMGWRPGRMWVFLGLGLVVIGAADAIFSIENLSETSKHSDFGGVLSIGALLIAHASWIPHPGRLERRELYGWKAIALPFTAQAIAAGLQVYGYFNPLPESERIFTFIVLSIAMIQIVMTRPQQEQPV